MNYSYIIINLLTAAAAFAITAVLGWIVIPWLHKLKYGQTIKEIGPTWHSKKQGTPTMGGIMFIVGIIVACAVFLPLYGNLSGSVNKMDTLDKVYLWGGLAMGLLYGIIGFVDDYISVVKKRNTGLLAWQKYLLQVLVVIAYLAAIWLGGDHGAGTTLIPFSKTGTVDLGIWFYIISVIVITGFVNAVNLTDGIDGLCTSVTFFAVVSLMLIAGFVKFFDMGIVAASVAGGCLGFLVWNFYPAKVFMGDTGSLFLGGLFCAVAYGLRLPILIPLIGLIYLCEAGSVMLQVAYFKLTHGKRIFKMSPIHHHFEMSGWSEIKIVIVFSCITIVCGIIAALLVGFGG